MFRIRLVREKTLLRLLDCDYLWLELIVLYLKSTDYPESKVYLSGTLSFGFVKLRKEEITITTCY